MTIKQLKEELEKYDENLEVIRHSEPYDSYFGVSDEDLSIRNIDIDYHAGTNKKDYLVLSCEY